MRVGASETWANSPKGTRATFFIHSFKGEEAENARNRNVVFKYRVQRKLARRQSLSSDFSA